MTKNHILIKSVALSVLLTLSPFAKAQSADRALVEYFNKLYKSQQAPCFIDETTKSRILKEIEPKCLVRTTQEGQSYISGVQSGCTQEGIKASVDAQIKPLCENTAAKAHEVKQQQAQANAAAQQQSAANKNSGGSGSSANPLNAAMTGIKTVMAAEKIWNEDNSKQNQPIKEIPKVGTSAINGNDVSASSNNAIDKTNAAIKEEQNTSTAGTTPATPVAGTSAAPTNVTDAAPENTPAAGAQPTGDSSSQGDAANLSNLQNQEGAAKAEAQAGLSETPSSVAGPAKEMLGQTEGSVGADAANATKPTTDAAASADATFTSNMTKALTQANTCVGPSQAMISKIQTAVKQRDLVKTACSKSNAAANYLCPMTSSPQAIKVQKIMSLGAAVLSNITAASEACGTTSNLSKIAQAGMLLGQVTCASSKSACDLSCEKAETQKTAILSELKTADEAIKKQIELYIEEAEAHAAMEDIPAAKIATEKANTCTQAELGAIEATNLLNTDSKPVVVKITECKAHSANLALMGSAALGFLSASLDGKKCKEQLATGGSGGGKSTSGLAGPSMTTAEYCAQPQNATSITCKCTANPNADGCMGSLAKSGVALGKINANGSASGFASAKQNGLGSLDPLSKAAGESSEPPPGAGLSEAAREALGIGTASSNGGAGSVNGNFGNKTETGKAAKEEKEKPKFGFFSSLGNMLSGGRKPDQAAKAAIRNYEQDQAIKRKIASEQLRAQITTASGKSNFDKIRSRYRENASSFEQ